MLRINDLKTVFKKRQHFIFFFKLFNRIVLAEIYKMMLSATKCSLIEFAETI